MTRLVGLAWPAHPHELRTDRRFLVRFAGDLPQFASRGQCCVEILYEYGAGLADQAHVRLLRRPISEAPGPVCQNAQVDPASVPIWSATISTRTVATLGRPAPVWLEDCVDEVLAYQASERAQ